MAVDGEGCGGPLRAEKATVEAGGRFILHSGGSTTTIVVRNVNREALLGGAQFANQPFFFIFSDDGSFEAHYFLESEHPFDFGTYEFDGRTLTLRSSPRATWSPCGGLSATYIVSFSEDEQRFTLPEAAADDECQRREGEMTRVEFTKQQ